MGHLDGQHRSTIERGGEEAHLRSVDFLPQEIQDQDRGQVKRTGKNPSHQDNLVVSRSRNHFSSKTRQEQRQHAVGVKSEFDRVECGIQRVKVGSDTIHRADPLCHDGHKTFVRVQVAVLVPVDSHKTEIGACQEYNYQTSKNQKTFYLKSKFGNNSGYRHE